MKICNMLKNLFQKVLEQLQCYILNYQLIDILFKHLLIVVLKVLLCQKHVQNDVEL